MSRNQFFGNDVSLSLSLSLSLSVSHITYQNEEATTAPLAFSSTRQDKNPCKRSRENTFSRSGQMLVNQNVDRSRELRLRKRCFDSRFDSGLYEFSGFRGVQIKQRSRSIYDQQSTVSVYIYIYIFQRSYLPSRIQKSPLYLYLKCTRYIRVKILIFLTYIFFI